MQILILKHVRLIAALCFGGSILSVNGAAAQTPVKFSIDWVFQGAHAPFAVAIQKNYYKREGLDVTMDRGAGSGDTIGRVALGTYDIGYGDTNLLVKFNHEHPESVVTAAFMVYNSTPAGVVTLAKTGIREPKDLAGRNIASPIGDAARLLFPAFAQKVGIDSHSVEWTSSLPNLRDTLLFQGKVDAVGSYVPTTIMALEALGAKKDDILVFNYSRYLPGLLGSGILVKSGMLSQKPAVVRAFVKGTIAGLQDALKDPEGAVQMLTQYDRLINVPGEVNRLKLIISYAMQGDLLKQQGLGFVSQAQLREGVDLIATVNGIAAPSDLSTIYDETLLPPADERKF
jgi:NitT/TauT family transport system substrate-binding protein